MDSGKLPEFFYEIFDASLPRLGAGNEAATIKALQMLRSAKLRHTTRILDLGCGNGDQTVTLAQRTEGSILAVDNHQPYLDELQRRAAAAGVSAKIQVSLRDMRSLEKSDGPFDLIWSEGSLFVMGFREGLAACHSLLAPGGELAVSELCWLRSDPPADCRRYFDMAYPALADIEANLTVIQACDYEVLGHFTLPESAWWEHYYHPLEERLHALRKRYAADTEKLSLVESIQMEIDLYRQYSAFYGYAFYLMQGR